MKNLERLTLAGTKEFVMTNRHVGWSMPERASVYVLIERVLKAQSTGDGAEDKRHREEISGQGHHADPRADDASDPALDRDAADREEAGAAAELSAALHRRRYRHAGRGGRSSRGSVRSCGAALVSAGRGGIWEESFQRLAGVSPPTSSICAGRSPTARFG